MKPCLLVVCALPLLFTRFAFAQDAEPTFQREATRYFDAERSGAAALVALGVGSVGTGVGLLALSHNPRSTGAAYPALAFGAIQATAGAVTLVNTRGRRANAATLSNRSHEMTVQAEAVRMRGVVDSYFIIEMIELTLIAAGATTAAVGYLKKKPLIQGVGLGLASVLLVTLAWDLVADARATRYLGAVETLRLSASAGTGRPGLMLQGAF